MDAHVPHYGIMNLETQGFWAGFTPMGSTVTENREWAKSIATELNQAMKPEFQVWSVVTVVLNPEV